MKRVLKYLLLLLLIPMNLYAKEETTFYYDDITYKPNEELTLKIQIKNNPGFGILNLKVSYDKNSLEYIDGKTNGLDNAIMSGVKLNADKDIVLYALTVKEDELINDNGCIALIKFKSKNSLTEPNIKINIENFGINENESLPYEVIDGKVTLDDTTLITENNISLIEEIPNTNLTKEIIWKSSDESIATVDSVGNVTFKKNGNVTLTAQNNDGIILEKKYTVNLNNEENQNKTNLTLYLMVLITFLIVIPLTLKKTKGSLKK